MESSYAELKVLNEQGCKNSAMRPEQKCYMITKRIGWVGTKSSDSYYYIEIWGSETDSTPLFQAMGSY